MFQYQRLYQLALTTPGIFPSSASSLKHMRQIPYLLMYALERPHRLHRLYVRTLNLGALLALAIKHFLAT